MAHSRTFDKTDPANTDRAGLGAQEIREFKEDFEERFGVDHKIASGTASDVTAYDGYHSKLTMGAIAEPTAASDLGIVYTKNVTVSTATTADLHYINADTSAVQLTSGASLGATSQAAIFDTLALSGTGTFKAVSCSAITATGAAILYSTLAVTGSATFASTVYVAGAASFGAAVYIDGGLACGSALTVTGIAALYSTLYTAGAVIFASSLQVGTTFTSTGAATFSSTLEVTGSTEALVVVDSGSVSATEQDWVQVTVGGNTGYIRVFAAK